MMSEANDEFVKERMVQAVESAGPDGLSMADVREAEVLALDEIVERQEKLIADQQDRIDGLTSLLAKEMEFSASYKSRYEQLSDKLTMLVREMREDA